MEINTKPLVEGKAPTPKDMGVDWVDWSSFKDHPALIDGEWLPFMETPYTIFLINIFNPLSPMRKVDL